MKRNIQAFTLIELLVVVLIVGILTAVALPQYQKAIWRSRNVELKQLVTKLAQAQQVYYLTHGKYSPTFDELDMDISYSSYTGPNICSIGNTDRKKNNNFVIHIKKENEQHVQIFAYYSAGPFSCRGFSWDSIRHKLYCFDLKDSGNNSKFCTQVEHGVLEVPYNATETRIVAARYAI